MVLLRRQPEATEEPGEVRLQPKLKRPLRKPDLYEALYKPEAQIMKYDPAQNQPEIQEQELQGPNIHAGLAKAQAGKQFPELQPGQRVRMPDTETIAPQHFQSFYDRLESVVNMAKQQRLAEGARRAFKDAQAMQDLLSQTPPAFQGAALQYQQPTGGGRKQGGYVPSGGGVQNRVRRVASNYGWQSGREWDALLRLVQKESSWNPRAANPTSSARGLFQKMTSLHGAVEPSVEGQAQWGLDYIRRRYGSPSRALAFHNRNNWY